MSPLARQPADRALTPAERQQRRRARTRDGRRCYLVEIDHAAVTADLVDNGLLDESDIDDPVKASQALSRALELMITVTRDYNHRRVTL